MCFQETENRPLSPHTGYKAVSENGCELRLFFDEDREEMSITVKKEQDYGFMERHYRESDVL